MMLQPVRKIRICFEVVQENAGGQDSGVFRFKKLNSRQAGGFRLDRESDLWNTLFILSVKYESNACQSGSLSRQTGESEV